MAQQGAVGRNVTFSNCSLSSAAVHTLSEAILTQKEHGICTYTASGVLASLLRNSTHTPAVV